MKYYPLILLAFVCTTIFGQEVQTHWFDKKFKPVAEEENAKFKSLTSTLDSITTIRITDMNNRTLITEYYKSKMPVGVWMENVNGKVVKRDFQTMKYMTQDEAIKYFDMPLIPIRDTSRFIRPSFRGGDKSRLKYLAKHTVYPNYAMVRSYSGTTKLAFKISEEGIVEDVIVIESSHPYLDYEAVKVVRNMPRWKPAILYGQPVSIMYFMPIKFTRPSMR